MRVVMYSPWPNRSFVAQLEQYAVAAQQRDHKREKTYVVRARDDVLNDLDIGDRLYICGHGIEFADRIKADGDTPWLESYSAGGYTPHGALSVPALDPAGVISWLNVAGLPTGVSDIRLWVCKGGDTDFTRFGLEFTNLIRKRIKSARVTAYKGYMLLTDRKRGQMDRNAFESQPAKEHKELMNTHPIFVKLQGLGVYSL
jgi:hypothetical protein